MKPKPDAELAKWCAALAEKEKPEIVPPGWKTAGEVADMLGRERCTAQRYLSAAILRGKCETKRFRVKSGNRSIYPVPHYRLTT